MGQIKNIKLHIVTDIKMSHKREGSTNDVEDFLLIHGTCWLLEDKVFPSGDHQPFSAATCPATTSWTPLSILNGSLLQKYNILNSGWCVKKEEEEEVKEENSQDNEQEEIDLFNDTKTQFDLEVCEHLLKSVQHLPPSSTPIH